MPVSYVVTVNKLFFWPFITTFSVVARHVLGLPGVGILWLKSSIFYVFRSLGATLGGRA